MADINEFGFERWLKLNALYVCESFLGTTQDVSENLMADFRTVIQQEQALDELGLEQSMKVDHSGLIEALNKGMLDIMKSMHHYLFLQQEANYMYNEHERLSKCSNVFASNTKMPSASASNPTADDVTRWRCGQLWPTPSDPTLRSVKSLTC